MVIVRESSTSCISSSSGASIITEASSALPVNIYVPPTSIVISLPLSTVSVPAFVRSGVSSVSFPVNTLSLSEFSCLLSSVSESSSTVPATAGPERIFDAASSFMFVVTAPVVVHAVSAAVIAAAIAIVKILFFILIFLRNMFFTVEDPRQSESMLSIILPRLISRLPLPVRRSSIKSLVDTLSLSSTLKVILYRLPILVVLTSS